MTDDQPRGDGGPDSAPTAPPARAAWPRAVAVVAVIAIGCTVALVNATEVRRDAERREALVADQTASVVASTVQQLEAALGGAQSLVDADGDIDTEAFEAFATGAIDASPFRTLALAPVVPQAERPGFEAMLGSPIVDRPGGTAAGPRAEYVPVSRATPVTPRTEGLLGFDLLADPVRGAALRRARDEASIVITRTVAAQPAGEPAVFVVQPIYRSDLPADASVAERRAAITDYLITGMLGEDILDAVTRNLPDPPAVRIADVDTGRGSNPVLAETADVPHGGTATQVTAGGRQWHVTVDDLQPTTTAAPWWILGATAALALLIALLSWRAVRHQREVDRHVETIERLADRIRRDAIASRLLAGLAEAAATAGTAEEVARTLVAGTIELPGARSSHIGVLSDDGRSLVVVQRGIGANHEIDVRPLDDPWPLVDAFRHAETVLLADLHQVAERYPEVVDRMRAAGMEALACLPLAGEDGRAFGVLAFTWPTPQRFDDDLVGTLRTVADLCRSSIDRALATDRAHGQASALATLASHLAAATSFDEVGTTIAEHATTALGAELTLVGVVEGERFHLLVPDTPALASLARYSDIGLDDDFPALIAVRRRELVTFSDVDLVPEPVSASALAQAGLHAGACAPLLNSEDEATGVFMVLWARPPVFDDALRSLISTVADLCSQSAERARLFDDDHRVRRDLQHTVLARIPTVPGVDVATRYLPAAQSVGLGGDWYDAIALDGGRLCLVVGDITGHGVGAVAEMTQVRTVVHTLAAGGMALPEILSRTSVAMQRDGLGYATVLIGVIDPADSSFTYVTAGHPPALVRRPGGIVDTLTGGRHSVLGIDLTERPPGFISFPPGATLVLYTDGLIERRDAGIDTSIAELADTVRNTDSRSVEGLADALLASGPARDAAFDD
ncbi:MAG: SpoIIE family protein phosphatase, partial [Acidimicrobiales bacterium]|nr:SpoIIE family protein phosphatase [Acidimicrobiales bacterium]